MLNPVFGVESRSKMSRKMVIKKKIMKTTYNDVAVTAADDVADSLSADDDSLEYGIRMTNMKINILKIVVNQSIRMCRIQDIYNLAGKFQMASSQDMELSQDSQGYSQEEGASQGAKGGWKCPKCPKSYQSQKTLRNHLEKKHGEAGGSGEAGMADDDNSQPMALEEVVEPATRKRKEREDDSGDERPRARMSTISEEVENLDLNLLDDTFSSPSKTQSTQGLVSEAARLYEAAERVEVDVEDKGDDSMEEDREKALEEMGKKLDVRDALLHSRNALLAQKDADLAEAGEMIEQRNRALEKSKKDLEEKSKEVEALIKRLEEVERKTEEYERRRESSPEKEVIKGSLAKANEAVAHLTGRVKNLSQELNQAKKNLKRSENDVKVQEKLEENFEHTLRKLQELETELAELKNEKARLQKRIPCTIKDCQNGRTCVYSHQLMYEDKSEPRDRDWRKKVPCRFFLSAEGCFKSEGECLFSHQRAGNREREETGRRPSVDEGRRSREIEITVQRTGEGASGYGRDIRTTDEARRYDERRGGREAGFKRRRLDSERESGSNKEEWSGNGNGASRKSRLGAPGDRLRHKSISRESSNVSSKSSPNRGEKSKNSTAGGARAWSPIRSPEDTRDEWKNARGNYQRRERRGRDQSRQGRQERGGQRGRRGANSQGFKGVDPWL